MEKKENTPDSGSIYILLCNSLDLLFFFLNYICSFTAENNPFTSNIFVVYLLSAATVN